MVMHGGESRTWKLNIFSILNILDFKYLWLCTGGRAEPGNSIYKNISKKNRGLHQERNIFKFFNKIFFLGKERSSCHQIFQSKSQHRKYYLKTCIQKEKCGETKTYRYKVKWLYEVILTSPCVELDED